MRSVSVLLGVTLAIAAYVVLGLFLTAWLAAIIAAAIFIGFVVAGTSPTRST